MVVEEVEETQTEQDSGSRGRELVFFWVFFLFISAVDAPSDPSSCWDAE